MNKGFIKKGPIFLYILVLFSIVFLGEETAIPLTDEDGLVENLGAIYFLTASLFYLASFLQSSGLEQEDNNGAQSKNYFYLFFTALFFFGFGEEISWGQRLMDFEGPQVFQEINKHKETNLHNLRIFGKGFLRPDIWFFIFWFSYCLILPLVNKYSARMRKKISGFGLPVPPIWIGLALLTNFLIYAIPHLFIYTIPRYFPGLWPQPFYVDKTFLEVKESNAAFIFAVLAFHELKKQLLKKKENL